MANLESISTARTIAQIIPTTQSAADTSPLMVVQYVPALGTGGATANITFSDPDMTFTVIGAAPAGADAIGTAGVISVTEDGVNNTMGLLVDIINATQAWRAYLVAALRSDQSSLMLAKAHALGAAAGDTGVTFYGDTSVNQASSVSGTEGAYTVVGTAISGEQFVNNGIGGHYKDNGHATENSLLYAEVQLTFTGLSAAGSTVPLGRLQLYSGKQGEAETLLYNQPLRSTLEKNLGRTGVDQQTGLGTIFLTAPRGERLIIRAITPTDFSAYTKFNVLGKSAVISGDHLVDTANFTAG